MIHVYLKRKNKIMIIVNIGLDTSLKAISRYHGCHHSQYVHRYIKDDNIGSVEEIYSSYII